MSLVFVRPLVKDGMISGSDWLNAAKPVDALMVEGNFRSFYAAVNGDLHGRNLNYNSFYDGFTGKIGEYQVQFRENTVDTATSHSNPISGIGPGASHSHDGIDSSFLDDNSVDIGVTKYTSYGAYQFPSKTKTLRVHHGVAELSNVPTDTSVSYFQVTLDVPQDDFLGSYKSVARCFAQFEVDNPAFYGVLTNPLAHLSSSPSGRGYLIVTFGLRSTNVPVTIDGVRIHWAIFLAV